MRQSLAVRNAKLNATETAIGVGPILRIFSGTTEPATEGAASTGTLLAEGTLPADWAAAASGGSKVLAGDWTLTGVADGTAGHYELFAADGTTRHQSGLAGGPGSGREMILNSTGGGIVVDQELTVTTWTHVAGNAWA